MLTYLILLLLFSVFFFFKQKTAYERRISDWSSDVCSSDLFPPPKSFSPGGAIVRATGRRRIAGVGWITSGPARRSRAPPSRTVSTARREAGRSHRTTSLSSPSSPSDGEPRGAERPAGQPGDRCLAAGPAGGDPGRESGGHGAGRGACRGRYSCGKSEEHTSELQSLMRNSYTVFFLKKKKSTKSINTTP